MVEPYGGGTGFRFKIRDVRIDGRGVARPESHDVLGWWKADRPDGPGPESTVGTIIVEN